MLTARRFTLINLAAFLTLPGILPAQEKVDLSVYHRIRSEAFQNSKIMETLFYLSDVHGPRITNSPGYHAAADWTIKRMQDDGIVNVKKEKWGPFGRSWTFERFSAHLVEPSYASIPGFPLAWTPGTDGPVKGEPILAPIAEEKDFDTYRGKLKGRIIMIDRPRQVTLSETPLSKRYSDAELADIATLPLPTGRNPQLMAQYASRRGFRNKLNQFLKDEGVSLVLSTGYRGDGGTIFSTSGGPWDPKDPTPPPMAAINTEHYNRIARLLEKKIPVQVEFDFRARFLEGDPDTYNIIGEIPGTSKKDEVVILGGHFDSWHGGTGAVDNATGVAVMMEAARILKSLNLPMARTVRLAFWAAEEQGLLGARAYVKEHYADRDTMQLKPGHAKMNVYFNYDNGAGKIRGIYLQGNDMLRPVFEAWLAPFKDLGASTVSLRNTGGTDHQAFDAVGLPGFQFIQDPLEYSTRTHHSNMDQYDRIQPGDMMQSAAVVAALAYQAATREEMLPRKPLPQPAPDRRQ